MKLFSHPVRAMGCMAVGRRLQRYLDGQLDARRAARIAAHLEHCLRCGLEVDAYERIKASLAQHGADRPEDAALTRLRDFADRLVAGDVPGGGDLPGGGDVPGVGGGDGRSPA